MQTSCDEAAARAKAQRAAIAAFGIEAFRSNDLQGLLTNASSLVAQGIGVERVKVLEVLPREGKLLIRAGVGWKPGVVGKVTIDADHGSAPGYALLTAKPVISSDVEHDRRFRYPEVLRQHGIKSAVNVIIQGVDKPFGVLEVDSQHSLEFTEDDINFLQEYANLLAAAIERLHGVQALTEANHQKEVLLRELQHRIKNGLQTIAGLVSIERRRTSDPNVHWSLDNVARGIHAFVAVYEKLSAEDETRQVDFCAYLEDLCRALGELAEQARIELEVRCRPLFLDSNQALPLGLFVNEFISNSLKHAFPNGGDGTITVRLEGVDKESVHLTLADNGIGASDPRRSHTGWGWGWRLMELLAKQAHASLVWDTTSGTKASLAFSVQPRVRAEPADRAQPFAR